MDTEIQKWKKMYPNLDTMMIETILQMTDEQHEKFQRGLESGEMCEAPTKLILEDKPIDIYNFFESLEILEVEYVSKLVI